MKYCRYCAFCISGDAYYCTLKEKELSSSQVYKPTNCNDFDLSELGCVDTGRQYKPRKKKEKADNAEQMEFEEAEKALERMENHE